MTPNSHYTVVCHKKARQYITNRISPVKWRAIEGLIAASPKQGGKIIHLKAQWLCNYRWSESNHRILYEVDDAERRVRIFKADHRSSVYR